MRNHFEPLCNALQNQIKLTHARQNAIFSRATTPFETKTPSPTRAWPRMPVVVSSPTSHPVFLFSLSFSLPLPPQRPIIVTSPWGIPKIRAATGLVSNEKAVHRPIPTRPTFPRPSKQCERSATYQMIHAHAHPRGKRGGGDGTRSDTHRVYTPAVTRIRSLGPPFPLRPVNFGKKEHPLHAEGIDRCSINIASN